MLFDSYGPYELSRKHERNWRKVFWEKVESDWEGLSTAIGCYAYCLDTGKNIKPWYVGKTTNQNGFRDEVFTKHKLDHYDSILNPIDMSYRKGRPYVCLFPLVTETWRLSMNRSSAKEYIEWLETALIGMAFSVNPEIVNISKTKHHREVFVSGVIGSQFPGPPNKGAKFAKRVFVKN